MERLPRALALSLACLVIAGCARPQTAAAPEALPAGSARVVDAGRPGALALSDAQAAEVRDAAAKAEPARRLHLRYAFGRDESGKPRLVVYDDLGLGASGKTGRKSEYVIFKMLNSTDGSHYDPQQNAVISAIPPPPDRDMTIAR